MLLSKKKLVLIGIPIIILILGLDAFVIEPNIIETSRLQIPGTGTEMRIGLIADFQRQNADPAFVSRVVDMLNNEELDTVLIAGDFIHYDITELPSLEPLKELQTSHGVFGVLGNHDYNVYSFDRHGVGIQRVEKVIEYITSNDTIRILRNENLSINGVSIVGLDEYWAGQRNQTKAFAGVANGFKILLSHNQDDLLIDKDTADLYLFGHTHCGQVRLPVLGSIPKMLGFQGEYDYKHYTVNDAEVYTTCGLAPGPRFFNPTEVVVIELTP